MVQTTKQQPAGLNHRAPKALEECDAASTYMYSNIESRLHKTTHAHVFFRISTPLFVLCGYLLVSY